MIDRARRPLSRAEREMLFLRSEGCCQLCAEPISVENFHAAHLRAASHGGPSILENLQAWCPPCNFKQGAVDALDTRLKPRQWQIDALSRVDIPAKLARDGTATVAAAPGSGKTIYAALVFEALMAADVVDRVVIFTPRRALVDQWVKAWQRGRFLELRPDERIERGREVGCVCTYQSLTADALAACQRMAQGPTSRTLVIFDEVHHVGEREGYSGPRPAWAQRAMQLAGEIGRLNVAAVLNLSGTLWRSNKTERISTVRYQEIDGRLVSVVDVDVTAADLIREGQLRAVDLYKRGATVELVDMRDAQRVIGQIADLEDQLGRATIASLPAHAGWRIDFCNAVLERLEAAYRSVGGAPLKALIVARSQADARSFQETVNRLMRERHMNPFAMLAISDEPNSHEVLRTFRKQQQPGVLCTVDMAGEGYDCPEINVIGFATNKLTPLYIRQVVARAQRVTDVERQKLGRPLVAQVVIPDVPELVELMKEILVPMTHEIVGPSEAADQSSMGGGMIVKRYELDEVSGVGDGNVHVTGSPDGQGDVEMGIVRATEPHMRALGLPETDTPRALIAARLGMKDFTETHPFDAVPGADDLQRKPPAKAEGLRFEPLSLDETIKGRKAELSSLARWWVTNGPEEMPVNHFQNAANQAGGIAREGRDNATPAQLDRALEHARALVLARCKAQNIPLPAIMRKPS